MQRAPVEPHTHTHTQTLGTPLTRLPFTLSLGLNALSGCPGSTWWTECAGHSLNESGWSTCARPNLLTLIPVTNLLISGPRFLDSPCHTIVIRQSRHVEIGHVRVLAPPSYDQMDQSNNTDGIDVDGEYLYVRPLYVTSAYCLGLHASRADRTCPFEDHFPEFQRAFLCIPPLPFLAHSTLSTSPILLGD